MNSKPYTPFTSYLDLTSLFGGNPKSTQEMTGSCRNPDFSKQGQGMKMSRPIKIHRGRNICHGKFEVNQTIEDSLGATMETISPIENSGLASTCSSYSLSPTSPRATSYSSEGDDSCLQPCSRWEESYLPLTQPGTDYGDLRQPSVNKCNLGEIVQIVRQEIWSSRNRLGCVFCRKNGETHEYYKTHMLKDHQGRVICPVLRNYTCPICNAKGDNAHTQRHCPLLQGRHQPKSYNPNMY